MAPMKFSPGIILTLALNHHDSVVLWGSSGISVARFLKNTVKEKRRNDKRRWMIRKMEKERFGELRMQGALWKTGYLQLPPDKGVVGKLYVPPSPQIAPSSLERGDSIRLAGAAIERGRCQRDI